MNDVLNLNPALGLGPLCDGLFNDCFGSPSKPITAKVTDAITNQPLFGAHAYFQDTPTTGSATDFNGFFTLNDVPGGTAIVVSYIGYEPVTINSNTAPTKIKLMPLANQLQEVTVTAPAKKKPSKKLWGGLAMAALLLIAVKKNGKDQPTKAKV